MSYYSGPTGSGGSGVPTYPNFAGLPASANDGALAVTLDTDDLYVFNLGTLTWLLVGTPGGGGVNTIGAIDTNPATADGASISGASLFMQSASDTEPGLVNLTTQTFKGNKTIDGTIAASNLSGTNTGDVTIGTANGLSIVGQALSLATASGATTGALTSADWTTFNNKQSALTIGNITDTGTDGITVTGGTGSVIGSGTSIAQHVADASHNGYLSSTDWTTFNNKQSTITTGNLTDAGTDGITVTGGTGAVVGTGTSIAQHVADASHNGYLSSADWSTFNGKGSVSSVAMSVPSFLSVSGSPITTSGTLAVSLSGTALPVTSGGTGDTSLTAYAVLCGGTTSTGAVQSVSGVGTSGQVLTSNGASALPTWQAASGGGGPDSFIDDVSIRTSLQRSGGQADTIYDAYYTGFAASVTQQKAYLFDAYTSGGTTMQMISNAIAPADTYTDTTTGWSTAGNAGTLTTSATAKVGAASVSFNKTSGGTTAFLTRTPTALSLANNLDHYFWVNMPSVTNLTNVFFRIGTTSSNYIEWDLTTVIGGGAIATGWNKFYQNVGTGGSVVGTGWATTTVPGYYAIGVTAGNTQTYTAILIDGLFFGDTSSPASGLAPGLEVSIYNASTKDTFVIDSTNTSVNGAVTMAASVGNNYAATNTATFIQRSTLSISQSNFFGQLPTSSYGGTTAEERVTLPLQTSASNSNISGFVDLDQGYFYPVTTVTANTSIVVNAGADIHTFYESGCTFYAFKPIGDSNGNIIYYQQRTGSFTSSGSATNSSGSITIPTANTSGIVVGDYILKSCADLKLSTTAAGVNESYSSMSLQNIQVINPAISIPDAAHLYGYYNLSTTTNGIINKIPNTTGATLTIVGSPTMSNGNFYNGAFSTGVFSTSNYLTLPGAQGLSGNVSDTPAGMGISIWFYSTKNAGNKELISFAGNSGNGHYLDITTGNTIRLGHSTITDIASSVGAWNASAFNHVYYYINGNNTPVSYLFVNGVQQGTSTTTYTSPGAISGTIGVSGPISAPLNDGYVAEVIIWRGGAVLTAAQVAALYNNNLAPIVYPTSVFRYRYLNTAVTATQMEAKAIVSQVTAGETTNLRQFGFGRRS